MNIRSITPSVKESHTIHRFCVVLLLCLFTSACVSPNGVKENRSPVVGDIQKVNNDSSLKAVYVIPDTDTDLITVGMVVLAGEVDLDGPEGLAHYLEHLMFWHADKVNDESLHSRQGNAWVNGVTSTYYNVGELSELDDMFEFTRRILTPPKSDLTFMQEERKVVAREYDLRVLENPDYQVLTDMRKTLYAGHPISRSSIGTPQSIMSLTVDQATAFHNELYQPANAILIVVGNISNDHVTRLTNNYFSGLAPGKANKQLWRQAEINKPLTKNQHYPEQEAKSSRLAYASLSQWSGTDDPVQNLYTLELVSELLHSALPGSLAKPLRLDNFIVSHYELFLANLLDNHVELVILAHPDSGISLETVRTSIVDALKQLGKNGIPEKSLERLRSRMYQTAKRENKNSQEILRRAMDHLFFGLEPNSTPDHLQRIQAITKADVDKLLKVLSTPHRSVSGFITEE